MDQTSGRLGMPFVNTSQLPTIKVSNILYMQYLS
jgi:hypothetical protein